MLLVVAARVWMEGGQQTQAGHRDGGKQAEESEPSESEGRRATLESTHKHLEHHEEEATANADGKKEASCPSRALPRAQTTIPWALSASARIPSGLLAAKNNWAIQT